MGRAFGALLVRYVTGQTRVCVKRYRRLLAAASRTITSRSCLHVLPARVEARAVANWRKDDKERPRAHRDAYLLLLPLSRRVPCGRIRRLSPQVDRRAEWH